MNQRNCILKNNNRIILTDDLFLCIIIGLTDNMFILDMYIEDEFCYTLTYHSYYKDYVACLVKQGWKILN